MLKYIFKVALQVSLPAPNLGLGMTICRSGSEGSGQLLFFSPPPSALQIQSVDHQMRLIGLQCEQLVPSCYQYFSNIFDFFVILLVKKWRKIWPLHDHPKHSINLLAKEMKVKNLCTWTLKGQMKIMKIKSWWINICPRWYSLRI